MQDTVYNIVKITDITVLVGIIALSRMFEMLATNSSTLYYTHTKVVLHITNVWELANCIVANELRKVNSVQMYWPGRSAVICIP